MPGVNEILGMHGARMRAPGGNTGGIPVPGEGMQSAGGGGGGAVGAAVRTVIANLMRHPEVLEQMLERAQASRMPDMGQLMGSRAQAAEAPPQRPIAPEEMVAQEIDSKDDRPRTRGELPDPYNVQY